jgi:hypothetical protein
MPRYWYRAKPEIVLDVYKENGQTPTFEETDYVAYIGIEASDKATAEEIRLMLSDIRLWDFHHENPLPGEDPTESEE